MMFMMGMMAVLLGITVIFGKTSYEVSDYYVESIVLGRS